MTVVFYPFDGIEHWILWFVKGHYILNFHGFRYFCYFTYFLCVISMISATENRKYCLWLHSNKIQGIQTWGFIALLYILIGIFFPVLLLKSKHKLMFIIMFCLVNVCWSFMRYNWMQISSKNVCDVQLHSSCEFSSVNGIDYKHLLTSGLFCLTLSHV